MTQFPADILATAQEAVTQISARMEIHSTLGAAATEIIAEVIQAERERSRKLHRRVHVAEAVNQSVEGILAMWKRVLREPNVRERQEWLLFGWALDDIIRQRKKLSIRSPDKAPE